MENIIFPGVPCPSVPKGLSCYVFSLPSVPGEAGDALTKLLFLPGEVKTAALLCCAVSELYTAELCESCPKTLVVHAQDVLNLSLDFGYFLPSYVSVEN